MLVISKYSLPCGTVISATSPTFLPRSPFAIGVLIEIFASRKFASLSGTMVYCIFMPVFVFLRPTFVNTCTVSVFNFVVSMIFASAITSLSSLSLCSVLCEHGSLTGGGSKVLVAPAAPAALA